MDSSGDRSCRCRGLAWPQGSRTQDLKGPPLSASDACGRSFLGLSSRLAKMTSERVADPLGRARLASMPAGAGLAIPSPCPTSRCATSPRRWSVSRHSVGAWSTRERHARSARTPRQAPSDWRRSLSERRSEAVLASRLFRKGGLELLEPVLGLDCSCLGEAVAVRAWVAWPLGGRPAPWLGAPEAVPGLCRAGYRSVSPELQQVVGGR
jgi:hypothetical protein